MLHPRTEHGIAFLRVDGEFEVGRTFALFTTAGIAAVLTHPRSLPPLCTSLLAESLFVTLQAGISLRMVHDSDSEDKTRWMLVSWRLCLNWQESESHIPQAKRRSIVKPEQIQDLMEAINARFRRKSDRIGMICPLFFKCNYLLARLLCCAQNGTI